jgi:hypothetical protein
MFHDNRVFVPCNSSIPTICTHRNVHGNPIPLQSPYVGAVARGLRCVPIVRPEDVEPVGKGSVTVRGVEVFGHQGTRCAVGKAGPRVTQLAHSLWSRGGLQGGRASDGHGLAYARAGNRA